MIAPEVLAIRRGSMLRPPGKPDGRELSEDRPLSVAVPAEEVEANKPGVIGSVAP